MSGTPVTVHQGTDPNIQFNLTVAGTTDPYDLTGSPTLEFYIKDSPDDADGTPEYTTPTDVVITGDGSAGQLTVRFAAADIPEAATRYYKLDIIRSARRETLAWGPLYIIDT